MSQSAVAAFPTQTPAEWKTRLQLAASYRLLAAAGINDLTYNHLSARVPDAPDAFLVKSDTQLFEQVTASSLVLYSLAGEKLSSGPGKISVGGLVIHAGIMAARPDIMAVFHTHSPANMGVSSQRCGLLPISQHAMLFYNRIALHDFEGFEFDLSARERLIANLGDNLVMLMRNHGALVCGRSIAEAFYQHHQLEMACRAQIAALSIGGIEGLVIPPPEVCEFASHQINDRPPVDENGRDWPAAYAWIQETTPGFQH